MSPLDDRAFDALEDEVDRLAAREASEAEQQRLQPDRGHRFDPVHNESDFEELVRSALDELPSDVLRSLEEVAIVISEQGAQEHAYGYYRGITAGNRRAAWVGVGHPEEIVIFRDTLIRDFGHDPDLLQAEVRQTVRHEVGHYLGLDEEGVRRRGL